MEADTSHDRGRERGRGELRRSFFVALPESSKRDSMSRAGGLLILARCVQTSYTPSSLCVTFLWLTVWQKGHVAPPYDFIIRDGETPCLLFCYISVFLVWVAYSRCYLLGPPVHLGTFRCIHEKRYKDKYESRLSKMWFMSTFFQNAMCMENTIEPLSNDGTADKNILFSSRRVMSFF